jgi:uncharacterized protein YjbI with pentapeptide repeats
MEQVLFALAGRCRVRFDGDPLRGRPWDHERMRWPDWTGIGERRWKVADGEHVEPRKTLWDVLQLLIVPAMLALIALAFDASQASRDRHRQDRQIREDRALADQARQDATLQAYFEQMSGLILHEGLLTAQPKGKQEGAKAHAVKQLANTITLATLSRLNGERKGEVVNFLYGSALLHNLPDPDEPVVSLDSADLRGVDLQNAYLDLVDLYGADLRGANFKNAVLSESALGPDLTDVNFTGADLSTDDLSDTVLRGADFRNANLAGVDFSGANFRGAKNLNLGRFLAHRSRRARMAFLQTQETFLDSLSRKQLAEFNLSPERLAEYEK